MLQVRSPTVLWHKESLLNIALKSVPPEVPYVAWLDCDIFFQRPDWPIDALEQLRSYPIVQLFTELRHLSEQESLRPDESLNTALRRPPTAHGLAFFRSCAPVRPVSFDSKNNLGKRTTSFGIAWAGSTALMRRHTFYDAMIIGGGDRAMACAAYGRYQEVMSFLRLSTGRTAHYLNWATPYFAAVQGNVGHVPGAVFHLWHGNIEDRYYQARQQAFERLDFLPHRDLEREPSGVWKWRTSQIEFARFFQQYFDARREDGYGDEASDV
jgi:hypothetical protein